MCKARLSRWLTGHRNFERLEQVILLCVSAVVTCTLLYGQSAYLLSNAYLLSINAVCVGVIFWRIALVALRPSGSIRARLVMSSVLLVLFTGATITYFNQIAMMRLQQRDAIGRLSEVAARTEMQVEAWADSLQLSLALFIGHTRPQLNVLFAARAPDEASYNAALAHVQEDLLESSSQSRLFDELALLDASGAALLSTGRAGGRWAPLSQACLPPALDGPCLQPPRYDDDLGAAVVVAAEPILGDDGRVLGIVAGYARADALGSVITADHMGSAIAVALLADDGTVLTALPADRQRRAALDPTAAWAWGAEAPPLAQAGGSGFYQDERGVSVVGVYRWLPRLRAGMLIEQDQSAAFHPEALALDLHLGVTLLLLALGVVMATAVVRSITAPLNLLSGAAKQIADGALDVTAEVRQDDEIGALARVFNQMTARLRQARDQLEQRVRQRTEELARANDELQAENAVRRQAEDETRQRNSELAVLSRRLVEVQESERQYIARELHDEAGQALTSLMLRLGLLERSLPRDGPAAGGVSEIKRTVEEVIESLHGLAANLRPSSLDHVGLVPALRQYAERTAERHGLAVDFEAIGLDERRLPAELEIIIYRIVQEALVNVVRHAEATQVDVIVERRPGLIRVAIEDNGRGFNVQRDTYAGRLGLIGMRERAETIGGRLVVDSAPGSGTMIMMEAPYDDTHPHR